MFFYLKPPRGSISSDMLQKCAVTRLKFFLNGRSSYSDFEYLIFGSVFDRTGHFMLRLFVAIQTQTRLKNLLKEWETGLFLERLEDDRFEEKLKAFKILVRHTKEMKCSNALMLQKEELFQALLLISQLLSKRELCHHVFGSSDCNEDCLMHEAPINFEACPSLVKTRQVILNKGVALVPCGKWKLLLKELFILHIDYGVKELVSLKMAEAARRDTRLSAIFKTLNAMLRTEGCQSSLLDPSKNACSITLKSEDVTRESEFFPPCMFFLHKTLRRKHRLTHQARFHYSLFLKDVGMPVSESLAYWEAEYSQPHSSCSACTHSWQQNASKYIYGIRHLYGLAGGRKHYTTPTCNRIQAQSLTSRADDGCPFLHFDDDKFSQSLSSNSSHSHESEFFKFRRKFPLRSCQQYLSSKLPSGTQVRNHGSPVQFYKILQEQARRSSEMDNVVV